MELNRIDSDPFPGPRRTGALPEHVADKIARGEAPLKAIREWRHLSQDDLADRTGVAITQIARAERWQAISPAALRLLATGLRVGDHLLSGHR